MPIAFLGGTLVCYHNPERRDTFGPDKAEIKGYKLLTKDGEEISIEEAKVKGPIVEKLRDGEIEHIDIFLG